MLVQAGFTGLIPVAFRVLVSQKQPPTIHQKTLNAEFRAKNQPCCLSATGLSD